MQDLWKIR